MRRAHPFFVAALVLLGLSVAFPRLATGLPLPAGLDAAYKGLEDLIHITEPDILQHSDVGHQPTSEPLAHIDAQWSDIWAGHPGFTHPQGPNSALPSYHYPTTEEYSKELNPYDFSHMSSDLAPNGMLYHHPASGDVSGSDRQELLGSQRLLEPKPTSEATLSFPWQAKSLRASSQAKGVRASRQAKGPRASSQAKDSEETVKLSEIIFDQYGRRRTTHYTVRKQVPGQPESLLPLVRISSHKVGSLKLEKSTLEALKEKLLDAYPEEKTDIANLKYQPAPMVDPKNHRVTNGLTVEHTRIHLTGPFRKVATDARTKRASEAAPPGTLERLDQQLAQVDKVDGYSIVFARYPSRAESGVVTFSTVARLGAGRNDQKVWVGDIDIPKSIWQSSKRLKQGSKR